MSRTIHHQLSLMLAALATLTYVLIVPPSPVVAAGEASMTVADTPYTAGGNKHYVGNREPLLPSPLLKLPTRCVEPGGWVRHQLELMADGMTGHLAEISPWCQFEGNAWTDPKGEGGHGWEELPYWFKGFAELAYILRDERMLAETTRWIEAVLATQQPNGWFGPGSNLQPIDLWPNMIMMYALRSHYEATDDERVLKLMNHYCDFLRKIPVEEYLFVPKDRGRVWWAWIRGADNLDSIYWLYNRIGRKELLELAEVNHRKTAPWSSEIASWHGVNICEAFRGPGQFYQQSHEPAHLAAAERNYDTVMEKYGQVPGGMFGADENAREGYSGPRQAAETCSIVEFMHSHEILLSITGNTIWADRCEELACNALPAAQPPDLKALHYLTAPNQIQLDRQDKSPMIQNQGDMFSYSPFEQYRCCQHNVAFGWPYFARHMWMATQSDGLAAVFYAPSKVTAKVGDGTEVRITETTNYPFDGKITFQVTTGKAVRFPFSLRIPGWSNGAEVRVNGMRMNVPVKGGQWAILQKVWQDGDKVELELPMALRLRAWAANGNAMSVSWGPLIFSLKIGERWERYVPEGKPEKWACWQVFPTTPWNYALQVNLMNLLESFEIVRPEKPLAAQPFTPDAAPIVLKTKGRRLPDWKQEDNGLIGEIPISPVTSDEPIEDITLIPMGCARLRVTALPFLGGP